jgi:catechol 2,3-dioxygenase-like lactoylglutathione lyase family enzyme
MQHIHGIHHVAISVPDIRLARRFYVDLLGAREVSQAEWPEGTAYINEIVGLPDCSGRQFIARLGNAYIEVFEYLTPRAPAQDSNRPANLFGYTHFCLQVDDIDAVYHRLSAAGIKFHTTPKHGGGPPLDGAKKVGFLATYGRDYFGNIFELIEINSASAIAPL